MEKTEPDQARLDEVDQHIEQAEDKAKDLMEPKATADGLGGTQDGPPADHERVKPGTPAIGESEGRFEPPS